MKDWCIKCGKCCENLHKLAPLFEDYRKKLDRGDGICKYFNQETRLCTIYSNRPIICNAEKLYDTYFKDIMSQEEFIEMVMIQCRAM